MKLKNIVSISVLLGSVLSFSASAHEFYIFGGIGPTSWDTNDPVVQYDGSVVYQVGVGKVLPNVANLILEGSYINYGTGTSEQGDGQGSGTYIDTTFSAIAVKFGFLYDLSRQFSIFGKIGLESWNGETVLQIVPSGTGSIVRNTTTDSGTDLSYSIGGEFVLKSQSSIRIEYNSLDISSGNSDVGLSTVAVSYVYPFD